jgi:serine/threonine protein kinase
MLDEIAESESYETRLGDVSWTAPELVIDSSSGLPTSQSDVWSFGCNMIHVPTSFIDVDITIFNKLLRFFLDRNPGRKLQITL